MKKIGVWSSTNPGGQKTKSRRAKAPRWSAGWRLKLLLYYYYIFIWPTSTKPVGTKTLRKWNNGLQRASWRWTCFKRDRIPPL